MSSCLYFLDKYSKEDIAKLEKLHTKQLLKERNCLYHVSEYCADCCCDRYDDECKNCGNNHEFNMQQVKRILATREHIPNKQEAKALRKARKKKGT